MYTELRAKVQEELLSATFLSLTTDSWTGRNTKSFTTVTSQYMNKDWEIISYVLNTQEMTESHTADNLAADFNVILEEWKLNRNSVSVTTDNASNITLAMSKCGVVHIRCMAHTLNLASQKALQTPLISRICGKIRRIVGHFRRSTTAANLLRKATAQLELPDLMPVIDVTTRWNSTLDMLERFTLLTPAYAVVLANPAIRSHCSGLTERETETVEQLIKVPSKLIVLHFISIFLYDLHLTFSFINFLGFANYENCYECPVY
jgi:hypothetical protein